MELPLIRGRQQITRSGHLHTHGDSGASSNTNVLQVKVLWESEAVWLITAYFPNDLPGTIKTTRAVDTML